MQTQVRNPLSELTDRQRELLELIASDVTTSKALADRTGLKPRSIDTILTGALKILGAQDRKTAATRYLELKENSQPPSQLTISAFESPAVYAKPDEAGANRGLLKRIAGFFRGVPLGGEKHSLRWDRITLEVFRVAFIGLFGLTALVLFVLGFLRAFG